MTLAEYQNRWLDLVAIGHEETATARDRERRGCTGWPRPGVRQRRRWRAEADRVDDFIADAMHVLEEWFIAASEPLLAAFDERHPGDEWFGVILADNRASEAYGTMTLHTIIDQAEE